MRVLAVIPARCKSTRVPHKNLEVLDDDGECLTARALRVTMDAGPAVRNIEVSTDCVGVAAEITAAFGALYVFERDCGTDGPMVDVLLEVMRYYREDDIPFFDAVACIQPTSPFRRPEDIDGCIALLEEHTGCFEAKGECRSVVSVNEETGERNGAVYVTRVPMLRDGLVFDEHSLKYAMPAERSLDINEPADLELARKIAKERGW